MTGNWEEAKRKTAQTLRAQFQTKIERRSRRKHQQKQERYQWLNDKPNLGRKREEN